MSAKIVMYTLLAAAVLIGFPSASFAGCVGAAVGDGCIGVPTPSEHPYRYDDHDMDRHHHHGDTVIIKKRHHHDDDDED